MFQSLTQGQVLGGDFQIGRMIGEGGMGAVYEALQLSTGARRAVKVMQASVVSQPQLRERFVQEARIGSMIQSDHIVQVVAAGVDHNTGAPWLAMELLSGRDLNAALQQRGVMSPLELREVFAQLCHAVGAAHAANIVHRDLKPENIFLADSRTLGQSFTVKVLDFGIAKILDMARSKQTGAMGSQLWMAPEQTQTSDRIGPPTDVWALGLIAFYLMTGRPYWLSAGSDAGTAALLRDILIEPLVPASQRAAQLGVHQPLPAGFDAWFAGCVNRAPNERFANASQCFEALDRTLSVANQSLGPTMTPSQFRPSQASYPDAPVAGSYGPGVSNPGGYPSQPHIVSAYSVVQPQLSHVASNPAFPGQTVLGSPVVATATNASHTVARPAQPKKGKGLILGGLAVAAAATAGVLIFVFGSSGTGNDKKVVDKKVDEDNPKVCATAFRASGPADAAALQACEAACDEKADPNCRYLADLEGRGPAKRDEARADKLYAKGCDAKDEFACQRRMLLSERKNTAPDTLLTLAQAACDDKRAAGCTRAGDIQERRIDKNSAAQAAALYDRACEAGDPLGCADLGMMLEAGRRVKRDPAKASTAFGKAAKNIQDACTEGAGLECVALGYMLETGRGLEKDPLKAAGHYERACNAGVSEGCTNLGVLYGLGLGMNRDAARMEEFLKKGCDGGDKTACNNLGVAYSGVPTTLRSNPRGATVYKFGCAGVINVGCSGWSTQYDVTTGVKQTLEEARTLLQNACEGKEQTACVNFGAMVRYGLGGSIEADRANDLFKRACEAGNAGGCGEYGMMLSEGHGVPRNRSEGKRTLLQACDWGERDACTVNAQFDMYAKDNESAAVAELTKQCNEGIAQGCAILAGAYDGGFSVEKNPTRAFELTQRACEGKGLLDRSPSTCASLGLRYVQGLGTPKDPVKGYNLLRNECDKGNLTACAFAGTYLIMGTGVTANSAKGASELDALCNRGASSACSELSTQILNKKIPSMDDKKALALAERGCKLGGGDACALVGICYKLGRGATLDKAKAKTYFDEACGSNVTWACDESKKL